MLFTVPTAAVHDRISTIEMGLSLSLMDQEGTPNPNLTLRGYLKKF